MATSNAQKLAVQKYRAKTYDTIGFDVPKGKREEFKMRASKLGLSLAKFLFLAAEAYGGDFLPVNPAPIEKISAEERRLLDEFNKLPPDVQKSIAKMIRAINAELERDKIIAGK